MAETAGDRQERLERKLRKMEAEIADLRTLLAGRRDWGEEGRWWLSFVMGMAVFVTALVLAKYL